MKNINPTINRAEIVNKIITNVEKCYDYEQEHLHLLSLHAKTEGEIRNAAGNLVEHILQNIFDSINMYYVGANIESKIGSSDYLTKTIFYENQTIVFNQIQVDRHIFQDKHRIAFIENKTYLDSCYFDRALADFRKIAQSLRQNNIDPASVKFIVFAGQDAAASKTLKAYEADFWDETKHLTNDTDGLHPEIFFFLKGKRKSNLPLYKVKHELDKDSIRDFANYILDLIEFGDTNARV